MNWQNPARRREAKSNLLQQHDLVVLTKRFFQNHQIIYQDLGIGIVIENSNPPNVSVKFMFNELFFNHFLSKKIIEYKLLSGAMVLKLHPLYLERVKLKRKKHGGI